MDGLPCGDIDRRGLRVSIARVAHDSYIFPVSMSENIQLFRSDRVTKGGMNMALEIAGCSNIAYRLKENIGEQGNRLSAGEKQRVLIARALCGNAKVLLLDEAVASIDVASKKAIYESIFENARAFGRTVIVVDHDFATVLPTVDRHFILSSGELREIETSPTWKRRA